MMILRNVIKMFDKDTDLYFYDEIGRYICDCKVRSVECNCTEDIGISLSTQVENISFGDTVRLFIKQKDILENGKEYYFRVTQSAEGCSCGYVKMTPEQARFVNWVTDQDNWKLATFDCYDGSFSVSLDDWKTAEEVEGV